MGSTATTFGDRTLEVRRWLLRQRLRPRRFARRQGERTRRFLEAHRRPPIPSACWAPHSALYFRPDGQVQACCATGFEVGSVTGPERSSLEEIWNGALIQEHRARLEAKRFDLGCQECELAIETGGRSSSLAVFFDRWRFHVPMAQPKLFDFALSSRCNLQCVMCNGELSSSIRTKREGRDPMPPAYDDRFFDELAVMLPHAERIQFKGGEPFLAPENRRVWDLLLHQGSDAEISVTTNGTVWNANVERYVRDLRMEVNISIDGATAAVFEPIRVGADFERVWANVDRFQAVTEATGQSLTLSYCFMTTNWHELPEFLLEVDRREAGAYVILVNQPDRFDVLKLPADELAQILRDLEARRPALQRPDTILAWDRTMARLRSHLRHPTSLEVQVIRPTLVGLPQRREVDLRRLRRAIASGGATPLDARIRDRRLEAVSGPAWSSFLHPDRWSGIELDQMPELLNRIVGAEPQVEMHEGPNRWVSEAAISWADRPDLPSLRAWLVTTVPKGEEQPEPAHLLLVPAQPT